MTLIITVVHILVSFALIFVVLLQKGSGADMGAAFGGSSQSLFGARGSGDFLSKATAALATIFMITSLSLAFFTTRAGPGMSVMEKAPVKTEVEQKEPETPVPGKTGRGDAAQEKKGKSPLPPANTGVPADGIPTVPKSEP